MTARLRFLPVIAAAAALMAPAAPTHATEPTADTTGIGSADGVRYKRATIQIPGDSLGYANTRFARARCDAGWKAVSGGQTIGVKSQHAIASSGPEDGDKAFYASAWQAHDLAAKLSVYAVCVKTTTLSTSIASELNVPADSQVTDAAWCDKGHAVGGGLVAVGENSDFALNASAPIDSPSDTDTKPDDGWRVYTQYSGPGNTGKGAIVNVSCLTGSGFKYRTKTVIVPGTEAAYATAQCPKGTTVLGGGIYINGAASSSHVVASRPWDSGDSGTVPEDGWRAGVLSHVDDDLTMTVHTICR
jgi:hypothetical protein